MRPAVIRTERLVLSTPTLNDAHRVAEYCRDPLFERFLTLPWPYELRHAEFFLNTVVPKGWASGEEFTWALRESASGPLLGMVSWRRGRADIGFWIGAPHRGRGLMTEAVTGLLDWLIVELGIEEVLWECVLGNGASVSVARKTGFTYTGERATTLLFRDGSHPLCWHGTIRATDSREAKPGWPS